MSTNILETVRSLSTHAATNFVLRKLGRCASPDTHEFVTICAALPLDSSMGLESGQTDVANMKNSLVG